MEFSLHLPPLWRGPTNPSCLTSWPSLGLLDAGKSLPSLCLAWTLQAASTSCIPFSYYTACSVSGSLCFIYLVQFSSLFVCF